MTSYSRQGPFSSLLLAVTLVAIIAQSRVVCYGNGGTDKGGVDTRSVALEEKLQGWQDMNIVCQALAVTAELKEKCLTAASRLIARRR